MLPGRPSDAGFGGSSHGSPLLVSTCSARRRQVCAWGWGRLPAEVQGERSRQKGRQRHSARRDQRGALRKPLQGLIIQGGTHLRREKPAARGAESEGWITCPPCPVCGWTSLSCREGRPGGRGGRRVACRICRTPGVRRGQMGPGPHSW